MLIGLLLSRKAVDFIVTGCSSGQGTQRITTCSPSGSAKKLGMRREGLFREFVSFVNNPDGTPLYENTYQYAILKKEWQSGLRV